MWAKAFPLTVVAVMALAGCGTPSAHSGTNPETQGPGVGSGSSFPTGSGAISTVPGGTPGPTGTMLAVSPGASVGGSSSTAASPSARGSGGPTSRPGPPPSPPPQSGGGSCPDPRYCADYTLNATGASWPKDNSGRAVIHYQINDSIPAVVPLTSAQLVAAVQRDAQTWMAADPSVQFLCGDPCTTSASPEGFNNVVGFVEAPGTYVNIPLTYSSDGKTITAFNIQLNTEPDWNDAPCSGPCNPYPGSGVDLDSMLAHAWGHALGLDDFTGAQDYLLSDYGGIASGPDCSPAGPVCRFATTLGLGDILGARHLYPTSAARPAIYDDQ